MRLSTLSLSLPIALAVVLSSMRPAAAVSVISSTFDASDEGWTANGATVAYEAKGGKSKGFLKIIDDRVDIFTTSATLPPSKFMGDLSAFNGGKLTYDVRLFPDTSPIIVGSGFGRIQLLGGGSNATFDYTRDPKPPVPSSKSWKKFAVPMTAEAWHTTDENWVTVLSHVTYFDIILDPGAAGGAVGLDNFRLKGGHTALATLELASSDDLEADSIANPEPSSLVLLGTGLLGLIGWRRRRVFLRDQEVSTPL